MVGRFTSVDPARDGLNWYAYCNCDPVNFIDPNGKSAERGKNTIDVVEPDYYVVDGVKWYTSADDAAKAFAHYINEKSIEENAEYASFIYAVNEDTYFERLFNYYANFLGFSDSWYNDDVIYYTFIEPERLKNNEKAATESRIPINWSMLYKVADIHTHAAFDKELLVGNDQFSPDDIKLSKRSMTVSYVVTPRGYVRRYNPVDDSNDIIYRDAPYDPNHVKRR